MEVFFPQELRRNSSPPPPKKNKIQNKSIFHVQGWILNLKSKKIENQKSNVEIEQ